jgi:uncharacterized protein
MKRLFVLLVAAGGVAFWWARRGDQQAQQWRSAPQTNPFATASTGAGSGATATVTEEPPLGGDVDPELLAILACPLDKAPVARQGNYLVCSQCQRHYPIRDGIPVMLVDEALTPEQAKAAAS